MFTSWNLVGLKDFEMTGQPNVAKVTIRPYVYHTVEEIFPVERPARL